MLPIHLRGARTHNLRDLALDLLPSELVAIVGPSGSGKSSLAFATLYAEGQRRFIESFSPYARQFLERLARPDVDSLEPVAAAVAVDRQGEIRSSRATVGSLTDVTDYAKSLWAHCATLSCPSCAREVRRHSAESGAAQVLRDFCNRRILVCYRQAVADAEGFLGVREALVEDGYRRIRVDGTVRDLDEVRPRDVLRTKHRADASFEVVVDRCAVQPSDEKRMFEALEVAFTRGQGRASVIDEAGTRIELCTRLYCSDCDLTFADSTPGMFSFNSPVGACETCRGFGRVIGIDWDKVLDQNLSVNAGGILAWKGKSSEWERGQLKRFAKAEKFPLDVPISKLKPKQRAWLIDGDGHGEAYPEGWFGLRGWFKWLEARAYKMHVRVLLSRYRRYDACEACQGTRFKPATLAWKLEQHSIADFLRMSAREAGMLVNGLAERVRGDAAAELLVRELAARLGTLEDVGLGYLSLDRAGNTLSGGETQRVALTSALGASLTGAMFVLDEPTVGLHPSDVTRLGKVVRRLADAGNLVLMVEHDAHMIAVADRVIELGEGAGKRGGRIVFDGTPHALSRADTATGRAWAVRSEPVRRKTHPRGYLKLTGATGHNLKSADLTIPIGVMTCVTGVSGSGKSSLLIETLVPALEKLRGRREARPLAYTSLTGAEAVTSVIYVDQSPLGRTSRGNPATYLGAWDVVRKRFAREPRAVELALGPGSFSFNVEGGRCEACKGQGFETVEMQFLADVSFSCPSCNGKRFVGRVLEVRHRNLNVAELLEMTVEEALQCFADDAELTRCLKPLVQVGLSYLTLGQPLNTLSGGESQRLRLAEAVARVVAGALIVLDEPTAGLHPADVTPILALFDELVRAGATLVVIEHDMRVAAHADHVIDVGPGAGEAGGTIIACGTPSEVAQHVDSVTADFLRAELSGSMNLTLLEQPRRVGPTELALHVERAREHNLKNVSLNVSLRALTALTGPSGSGKSSLAFGVIHAEGQRRFMETLSPYARQYLPQLPRPDVDRVSSVPPTLSLEQRLTRGGGTSTVATVTEVAHYLRLLYARIGTVSGESAQFGVKQGAREAARMLIHRFSADAEFVVLAPVIKGKKGLHRELLDKAREEGIREARIDGALRRLTEGLALDRHREHDVQLVMARVSGPDLPQALSAAARRAKGEAWVTVGREQIALTLEEGAPGGASKLDPRLFSFNTRQGACPTCEGRGAIVTLVGRGKKATETRVQCTDCEGTRLSALARSVRVQEHAIDHYFRMSVSDARVALSRLTLTGRDALIGGGLLKELEARLGFLERLGLGYLGLDRAADSLSGGEAQRVRLSAQLGSGLSGVLYVLDEPTIGLHPRDTTLLIAALRDLVSRGNGVLVVEHDLETILASDWVVDMGPGGGRLGGTIVAQGTPSTLSSDGQSMTGRALRQTPNIPVRRSLSKADFLELIGASEHNLREVDVRIPLARFSVVTGVSGSGKSTLVRKVLLPAVRDVLGLVHEGPRGKFTKLKGVAGRLRRVVEVDQTPIGRTPRSVPATYVGVWEEIRKLLAATPEARVRGFDASRFSFNVAAGRCAACEGNGALSVEMSFLPDALLPCEVCGGMRFSRETLEVKLYGLSAGEILDLEIERAAEVFSAIRSVHGPLTMLCELGLGYLKLGQPSSTLSGGEAQRMKLVAELFGQAEGPTLYVLDEPTTGLHRSDVARLLAFLARFVERGDTLLLIEHHPDVMIAADYVLDLGPEGGAGGGRIVASGTPEEVAKSKRSHTAPAIREALSSGPWATAEVRSGPPCAI